MHRRGRHAVTSTYPLSHKCHVSQSIHALASHLSLRRVWVMREWRERYREAVQAHGVAAVSRATGIPRTTVLSVVAGVARQGSDVVARQRVSRLDALDAPKEQAR